MKSAIPERRVLEIWQSAVSRRGDLKTAGGEPVKVVYPGRPNDGRGADLKDAVIETGQGLFKGDIEIHVKSGAWQEHGHHHDPAYNQVVLHVAYEDNGQARRRNGLEIPTLPIGEFTENQAGRRLTAAFSPGIDLPCATAPGIIAAELEKAGCIRFELKAKEYSESMLKDGAGQALYRGLMTALGYAKNKTPMSRLAEAVPLEETEEIIRGAGGSAQNQLTAVLLGSAGLLPSQDAAKAAGYTAEEIGALEGCWRQSGRAAVMNAGEWEFFKVRPGNYPTRRIAGMAALLARMDKTGLLTALEQITLQAAADGGKTLVEALEVKADSGALIGPERAGDIIINVILPFYYARARLTENRRLGEAALEIYRVFRGGAENSLEKHMRKQLGLPLKSAASAIRRHRG